MDGLQQVVDVGNFVIDGNDYGDHSGPPIILQCRGRIRARRYLCHSSHLSVQSAETRVITGLFLDNII